MIRKIVVALIIIAAMLTVFYIYQMDRNRQLSPPGSAEITHKDLTVGITYSRPSVRNRLIFGPVHQGALQPYGQYWRLGANEATEITFSQDVLFNGNPVEKGTYRIYAIPGEEAFEIVLNSELGKWGSRLPNKKLDILSTTIPVIRTGHTEQFTIKFEPDAEKIVIIFKWSDIMLQIPVSPDK